MNIKVWDDKYLIKSDPYCYKVAEIRKRTSEDSDADAEDTESDGDTYAINIGYVNSVAECFRLIVEKEGRQNQCTTLSGYIKHLENINKKLEENILLFEELVGGRENVKATLERIVTGQK